MRKFVLVHDQARQRAADYIKEAPEGYEVVVRPAKMNNDQKAYFHAICDDLRDSELTWQGKSLTSTGWKLLLISGHAVASGEGVEVVTGLEGEFINLRESVADMRKSRGASLIEYAIAYCVMNRIPMKKSTRFK